MAERKTWEGSLPSELLERRRALGSDANRYVEEGMRLALAWAEHQQRDWIKNQDGSVLMLRRKWEELTALEVAERQPHPDTGLRKALEEIAASAVDVPEVRDVRLLRGFAETGQYHRRDEIIDLCNAADLARAFLAALDAARTQGETRCQIPNPESGIKDCLSASGHPAPCIHFDADGARTQEGEKP